MKIIDKTARTNLPPRSFEIVLTDVETADLLTTLKAKFPDVPEDAWLTPATFCNIRFINPAKGNQTSQAQLQFAARVAPASGTTAAAATTATPAHTHTPATPAQVQAVKASPPVPTPGASKVAASSVSPGVPAEPSQTTPATSAAATTKS